MRSRPVGKHWSIGGIAPYAPVLVGIGILLPRLLSPQFGLFDDGVTISVAEQVIAGGNLLQADIAHGRTRPVYWLFNTLLYLAFGRQPLGYFLANAVLLAVLTAAVVWLVKDYRRDPLEAGAAGLLFVLSGPVVESFYTLSKPEPLQLALVAVSLVMMAKAIRQRSRWSVFVRGLVSAGLLLVAGLTKETTVVMLGVAGAWSFLARWLPDARCGSAWRRMTRGLLVASLAALAVFGAARLLIWGSPWSLVGYAEGFQPSPSRLVSSLVRLGAWVVRDLAYLVPLAVAATLSRGKAVGAKALPWRLAWLAWALAWLAPYLGWVFSVEYYLLPASLGFSIIGASLVGEALKWQRAGRAWQRVVAGSALAATVIMFGVLQAANLTNARLQLLVDAVNSRMLETVSRTAPSGATVWVNLEPGSEYVDEIGLHLALLHDRPDLRVAPLPAVGEGAGPAAIDGYVLSPWIENQFLLSVRMGVFESEVVERQRALESAVGERARPALVIEGRMRNLVVDYSALVMGTDFASAVCERFRFQKYCLQQARVFDNRVLAYGWEIYRRGPGDD